MPEPTLEPCGCFTTEQGDQWPCSLHRGETEEQRKADEQQMAWEAAAMNGWVE